eukprot:5847683-Pyramimonas_sp.AAC.1
MSRSSMREQLLGKGQRRLPPNIISAQRKQLTPILRTQIHRKMNRSSGWGWRYTMWKHDVLYARSDAVMTALKADLESTSQTIFQRLYSQISEDPWTVHWASFERKATCRFDCAPPDLGKIPAGTFLQTHPDEKTKLVSRMYANPPGGYRGIVRPLEPGEVI